MHGQRRAFGEFDEKGARSCPDVEVAQKAVAQFQYRRGQDESLAIGQAEQKTGADERGGDSRDSGLRNAGYLGQSRLLSGASAAATDRSTVRPRASAVTSSPEPSLSLAGAGVWAGAVREGVGRFISFLWNYISVFCSTYLSARLAKGPARSPKMGHVHPFFIRTFIVSEYFSEAHESSLDFA